VRPLRSSPFRWALASGTVAFLGLAAWPCLGSAQAELPVTEEEIYAYAASFFDGLSTCNDQWLAGQFDRAARIRFISSSGRRQALTPTQYAKHVRQACQPYTTLQWDRSSTRMSASGSEATVQVFLSWGGNRGKRGRRSSTLLVHSRMDLARRNNRLVITGLSERLRELVPGAEEAFWAKAEEQGMMRGVAKFYKGLSEMLRSVAQRQRELQRDSGF